MTTLGLASESTKFGDLPTLPGAVCKGVEDADVFFPATGGGHWAEVRAAKAYCSICPVHAECLEWAVEHDELYGIWGGLTEKERRSVRRGRPALICQRCHVVFPDPGRSGPRPRFCDDCRGGL